MKARAMSGDFAVLSTPAVNGSWFSNGSGRMLANFRPGVEWPRRPCVIGQIHALVFTDQLRTYLLLNPPDNLVFAVPCWTITRKEQYEFVGNVDPANIEPHVTYHIISPLGGK